MTQVEIHYLRLPDRATVFRQHRVHAQPDCVITLMAHAELPAPVRAGGVVILQPTAPVVWFTFPDLAHDIGRFHLADGTFTGWYANVIRPVEFVSPTVWRTTDLFLDVWRGADGAVELLDEDELDEALRAGAIEPAEASVARAEAARLLHAARAGTWPPPVTREWTLERARAAAGTPDGNAV